MRRFIFLYISIFLLSNFLFLLQAQSKVEHNWHSNVVVARKTIKTFETLNSYSAKFEINVKEGKRSRKMLGTVYYQKPNKLRYDFQKPFGNFIVSNGKTMWFYVKNLNIVGKQDLTLKTKKASGSSLFRSAPLTGLKRLFKKYHYRFDTPKQPRLEFGKKYFIFEMEQREKIGGYESIRLYVDATKYFVHRAEGNDGYGKKSVIRFFNIKENPSLDGKLFQYKPSQSTKIVQNPLVD